MTARYQDNGGVQNAALVLLLNRAYSDDMAESEPAQGRGQCLCRQPYSRFGMGITR